MNVISSMPGIVAMVCSTGKVTNRSMSSAPLAGEYGDHLHLVIGNIRHRINGQPGEGIDAPRPSAAKPGRAITSLLLIEKRMILFNMV